MPSQKLLYCSFLFSKTSRFAWTQSMVWWLALLAVAGCSSIKGAPDPVFPVNKELKLIRQQFSDERIRELYEKAIQTEPDNEIGVEARNELILARMYAIDLRYRDFEQKLVKEARNSNFLLKLASLGLTSAATLISVSTTQAILAGVDTGVKGGSEAFNKDILVDRTVQVLITQMRGARHQLRGEIVNNLQRPVADYPLFLGLGQVEDYYTAGTLIGALANLTESVGAVATSRREASLKKISEFEIRRQRVSHTEITEAIANWFAEDRENRLTPLKSCYDKHTAALSADEKPPSISDLLEQGSDYGDLPKTLLDCLNTEHNANIVVRGEQ